MWFVKKILVPTDFSKASEVALDAAVELAKKFDASVVLMHAYHVPLQAYPTAPMAAFADLAAYVEDAAQKCLDDVAASVRGSGVSFSTVLRVGAPWEQILRTAKELQVGLIVMGSRGLRGLPRALMGSTAERVVRHAPIPVMTLHGPLPAPTPKEIGAMAADALVEQWLI